LPKKTSRRVGRRMGGADSGGAAVEKEEEGVCVCVCVCVGGGSLACSLHSQMLWSRNRGAHDQIIQRKQT